MPEPQRTQDFGQRQSPVDIKSSCTEYDGDLRFNPIVVQYSVEDEMEIANTGKTLHASIAETSTISGGPLTDTYRLEQFHFHWGSTDNRGSEHTLEGRSYAAELHFVHWNQDKYSSIEEAIVQKDGLAVLGVFLEVGDEHAGFRTVTDDINEVVVPTQQGHLTGHFNPKCLLPENTSDYWTYSGSLTTPPYSETVTWVVFREPIEVSLKQLEALRSLRCGNNIDGYIVDNFRDTCPIGSRTISASFS